MLRHFVRKARTALCILFFFSGFSGLVYEVVWLRMLIRILGSTTYATAVVLAAFMAGMAAGSYFIGRHTAGMRAHLRVYALLEWGVAVSALGLTFGVTRLMPAYRVLYGLADGERWVLTLFQSGALLLLLLIPTSLMGGTLPVLTAHARAYRMDLGARAGLLYGVNTLGAFAGVVGSGFVMIGELGESATLCIAIAINVMVAILAHVLSAKSPAQPGGGDEAARASASHGETASACIRPVSKQRLVAGAYAVSGFAAMAYEVVWARIFPINVGTSIYSFSAMLAFYLAGLGVGSLCAGKVVPRTRNPLVLFGLAQLAVALYCVIGMYMFVLFEPVSLNEQLRLGNMLLTPLVIVFPVTVILGAVFPAVCRGYAEGEEEGGRAVGRLYALNTLGGVLGSLVCGFVFISVLGTRMTMLALASLNIAIGVRLLLIDRAVALRPVGRWAAGACVAATLVLAPFSPDPFRAAIDRSMGTHFGSAASDMEVYYHEESVAATTTAFGASDDPRQRYLWINGIGITNLCTETKLMAHLPLLMHRSPSDMLVVCFGMGTTVRSARVHQGLRIDAVDLVPDVYACYRYFHSNAPEVLADPRVRCYVDDGRNFLAMRSKQYDVISIDPSPPVWSAGTVGLYTKEFFDLCEERLRANGIACLWVPPVGATEVAMIMRTFVSVFPRTYLWQGLARPYPGFFLTGVKGQGGEDAWRFRLVDEDRLIAEDLAEWQPAPWTRRQVLSLLALRPARLRHAVANFPVITDDRPRTEFPLWRSLMDSTYQRKAAVAPTE